MPDGCTERDHLAAAAKQTGDWSALQLPDLPRGCEQLWQIFQFLSAGRSNGMAPGPIPPSEYLAWQQLNHIEFTPWELDTLKALDDVALKFMAAQNPSTDTTKGPT